MQSSLPFNPWAAPAVDGYLTMGGKAADGMRQANAFAGPEQWQVGWTRPCTRDEWLELVPARRRHSQIPPARLQELLTGIGAAIGTMGGSFTMRCTTVAVTAARTSAP